MSWVDSPEELMCLLEELLRHGCPPHGGFGIGLNRLLMALLGLRSIEDTSLVSRGAGGLDR